jgi:hypothetical protein
MYVCAMYAHMIEGIIQIILYITTYLGTGVCLNIYKF